MAQSGTVVNGVSIDASGKRLGDISAVQSAVANASGVNAQNGITAATTQTSAGASATAQLIYGVNDIAVCANASDSVAMPQALPGARCYFFNSGAQTSKIFCKSGTTDTLNGTAGATGVTGPGAGKLAIGICAKRGEWKIGISA